MNEIREMINISYFDNKNTTLKEHCDIYSNIKKEVLDILNKYDIKYVVAETEAVKDLVKENQHLKEEFDRMFAIYHSRKLIKKFNDEYDEEDKMKNPNRDYACVCPDAEEVYKRYYELKQQLQQKEDIINKAKEFAKEHIFQFDGDKDFDALLEILDNKGE